MEQHQFTKYEIARIIGARALQIAMDAPLLLKMTEQQLKDVKYDALKIAETELNEGVLPIAINRPVPKMRKERLTAIKEDKVSDEELAAKEAQAEKEIQEDAAELGLVQEEEMETELETPGTAAEEQ